MIKKLSLAERMFKWLFHISLFLMIYTWACPLSIGGYNIPVYPVALTVMTVDFIVVILKKFSFSIKAIFAYYLDIFKSSKTILILLAVYFLWDLITLAYSPDIKSSLTALITPVQMIVFAAAFIYYIYPAIYPATENNNYLPGGIRRRLGRICINLGICSVCVSVTALIGYLTGWYTVFIRHITTIPDDNQYATVILIGYVAIAFFLVRNPWGLVKKYLCLGSISAIDLTMVYLSGSRRSFVLLWVLVGVISIYTVCHDVHNTPRRCMRRSMTVKGLSLLLCAACAFTVAYSFSEYMDSVCDRRYEEAYNAAVEQYGEINEGEDIIAGFTPESDLTTTINSINNGRGFHLRSIIWEIAFKAYDDMPLVNKIFGGGASNAWKIYDSPDMYGVATLHEAYHHRTDGKIHWMNPHNFFLYDLLSGGIVMAGLLLALLVFMVISLIKMCFYNRRQALLLFTLYLILYVTLILSAPNGMLWNKFFWLLLTYQVCVVRHGKLIKESK